MAVKGVAFDTKGFDKMLDNLSPESRKPMLKNVMLKGSYIIRNKIREKYKSFKPGSDLDQAIVVHLFPSHEGAVVRRYYVKGGTARNYASDNPFLRAYILNFINKGATDRKLKGKGKYPRGTNRGSIPATKFFRKGYNAGKNRALKEIERTLLQEIAKQARK